MLNWKLSEGAEVRGSKLLCLGLALRGQFDRRSGFEAEPVLGTGRPAVPSALSFDQRETSLLKHLFCIQMPYCLGFFWLLHEGVAVKYTVSYSRPALPWPCEVLEPEQVWACTGGSPAGVRLVGRMWQGEELIHRVREGT